MRVDIKKELDKSLTMYDYICISVILVPDDIIWQYNMLPLVRNGFIYLDICKGMYKFPQERRLANILLTEFLEPKRYFQCTHTPLL